MFLDDIEALIKEANSVDQEEDVVQEAAMTDDELVTKLAESLEDYKNDSNSRLGVAKMLTAIDILSN